MSLTIHKETTLLAIKFYHHLIVLAGYKYLSATHCYTTSYITCNNTLMAYYTEMARVASMTDEIYFKLNLLWTKKKSEKI